MKIKSGLKIKLLVKDFVITDRFVKNKVLIILTVEILFCETVTNLIVHGEIFFNRVNRQMDEILVRQRQKRINFSQKQRKRNCLGKCN